MPGARGEPAPCPARDARPEDTAGGVGPADQGTDQTIRTNQHPYRITHRAGPTDRSVCGPPIPRGNTRGRSIMTYLSNITEAVGHTPLVKINRD